MIRRRQPTRQDLDLRQRWLPADQATARAHRGAQLCRDVLAGETATAEPVTTRAQDQADDVLAACRRCYAPTTGTCRHCPTEETETR